MLASRLLAECHRARGIVLASEQRSFGSTFRGLLRTTPPQLLDRGVEKYCRELRFCQQGCIVLLHECPATQRDDLTAGSA